MAVRQAGTAIRLLALAALVALMAGCKVVTDDPAARRTAYTIAPQLREFYSTLGGADILGFAISADFDYSGKQCQYFDNALLCYDPTAGEDSHLYLYPLGRYLDLPTQKTSGLVPAGEQVVGDYPVSRFFQVLFNQLKGTKYAGYPISVAHVDYNRGLIIQYFENIGLAAPLDQPEDAYLLPYGAYMCADKCGNLLAAGAGFNPSDDLGPDQPFLWKVVQLGGSTVGQALTAPFVAEDGLVEQVYEAAVFAAPADRMDQVKMRALPQLTGQKRTQPGPVLYGTSQEMTFYPTEGELGYHVPLVFDAYIQEHGGWAMAGEPIAEPLPLNEHLVRQCYTYYCLDYDTAQSNGSMIQMSPLGRDYLAGKNMEAIVQSPAGQTPGQSGGNVTIQVGEGLAVIPANGLQKISVTIVDEETSEPRRGVVAVLRVLWPDGGEYTADFPPTDDSGHAELVLPARPKLKNGSIVPYEVCVTIDNLPQKCASNAYLIWNK